RRSRPDPTPGRRSPRPRLARARGASDPTARRPARAPAQPRRGPSGPTGPAPALPPGRAGTALASRGPSPLEHALAAAEIGEHPRAREAGLGEHRGDRIALIVADLDQDGPARREPAGTLGAEPAQHLEAVAAAELRHRGLVLH